MTVAAYLIIILIMTRTRKMEGFDMETAMDCTIYSIVGGVLGARLFYVALNYQAYAGHPGNILNIREGGLSWFGAMIGGFAGMAALSAVRKIPLGKVADFTGIHGTIALAVGRIGCFLNGCCYGRESTLPWAVEFREAHIHGHRHPTQLYESALLVLAFFLLLWWWKRKKFDGEIILASFGLNGLARFLIEFFRDNTPDQYLSPGSFSLAQYFGLGIFLLFASIIIIKRKKLSSQERCDAQVESP
jgi:phosphatidylglycerol:prolipoprotein diacylglycerol transferase